MILEYDPHRGGFSIKLGETDGIPREVTHHPLLNGFASVLMQGNRIFGVRSYWDYGGLPLTHLTMRDGRPHRRVVGTIAMTHPITTIDIVQVEVSDAWVRMSFTDRRGPDVVEPLDHAESGLRLWLTREHVLSIRAIPGRSPCDPDKGRAMVPQVAGVDLPRARLCDHVDLTSLVINVIDIKG